MNKNNNKMDLLGNAPVPQALMATIDLIVLGILKKEPMGAYDIQKLVEYRNISKWVKISTPSIYKKAIQLEEKGFIKGEIVKEGKMPEKAVYSLTDEGEKEFVKLMMETASKPIHFFLDFPPDKFLIFQYFPQYWQYMIVDFQAVTYPNLQLLH